MQQTSTSFLLKSVSWGSFVCVSVDLSKQILILSVGKNTIHTEDVCVLQVLVGRDEMVTSSALQKPNNPSLKIHLIWMRVEILSVYLFIHLFIYLNVMCCIVFSSRRSRARTEAAGCPSPSGLKVSSCVVSFIPIMAQVYIKFSGKLAECWRRSEQASILASNC